MSIEKQSQRVTAFRSKTTDLRSYVDACELVDWLNRLAPSRPWAYRQAIKLVDLLKQASRTDAPSQRTEIKRLLRPMRQCSWELVPRITSPGWYATQTWPPHLHIVVLAARLSFRGLDWVRQCSCDKWFLGLNQRSRFCSPQCKKTFEAKQRKTREGREKRRLYMQRHRALIKARRHKWRRRR
jgi:hypothetical protein